MMIDQKLATRLDRAAGPLYRQAAGRLRDAITTGRLNVGAALPTEADMAAGFGVSLITVRQALRELEGEGLIRKRAAKTAVVLAQERPMPVARDTNSFDEFVAATAGVRLEIDSYEPSRDREARVALGEDGLDFGLVNQMRLHGRMLLNERPVTEITIYFPCEIGKRLKREDFDNVVVFRSVERRLGIHLSGARIRVAAELADAGLAKLLDYEVGLPVLTSRILYLDGNGAPVEYTVARHRADMYQLSYNLMR